MDDFNTDFDLIEQLKYGHEQAVKQLFEQYAENIFHIANSILKDSAESEDVVVEVVMKIWNARTTLDEHGNLKTYIYVIAKRLALNKFRTLQYARKNRLALEDFDFFSSSEADHLIKQKDSILLESRILKSMPMQQQLVYKLSREEGLSYKEIALALNISPNTVRNHIVQALKAFRFYFQKFGYPIVLFFLLLH